MNILVSIIVFGILLLVVVTVAFFKCKTNKSVSGYAIPVTVACGITLQLIIGGDPRVPASEFIWFVIVCISTAIYTAALFIARYFYYLNKENTDK